VCHRHLYGEYSAAFDLQAWEVVVEEVVAAVAEDQSTVSFAVVGFVSNDVIHPWAYPPGRHKVMRVMTQLESDPDLVIRCSLFPRLDSLDKYLLRSQEHTLVAVEVSGTTMTW